MTALTTLPDVDSLAWQLGRLEQANLIRVAAAQPELAYIFRHALVQDSAYQSLVRADRRRVHRAAGLALEALSNGAPPTPELRASFLARPDVHDLFGRQATPGTQNPPRPKAPSTL